MRCGRRGSRCRLVAMIIRWAVTILDRGPGLPRLVTCSWVTAERLIARTLLCGPPDEWVDERGVRTRWPMRLCAPMTASWAST